METVTVQPDQKEQPVGDAPLLLIPLGDAVTLTLGQGRGSREDKRRAYN